VQPVLVEPMHPRQRRQLELIDGAKRAVDLHARGLIESDRRLGQSVIAELSG
jgi:hypothetical protein